MKRSHPSKSARPKLSQAERDAAALAQEALRGAEQRLRDAGRHLRHVAQAHQLRRWIVISTRVLHTATKQAGRLTAKPRKGGGK